MVIMASGIVRGRVRTTATESRNMAAIVQITCTSLILDIHVMINWHLLKQGICLPVSRDHVVSSNLQLIEVFFEIDR